MIQEKNLEKTKKQSERAKKKWTKKIEKDKKDKALIPPQQCGGIPRSLRCLGELTGSRILVVGAIYEERDDAELVVREYNEFMDRRVKFNKQNNKLRAFCPRKHCTFACTSRSGYYDTHDSTHRVWSIRTFFAHSCMPGRLKTEASNYTGQILPMILMFSQEDTKPLTHTEAQLILTKYVQRKLPHQTLNTVRSNKLRMMCGKITSRLHLFPEFLNRLE